MADQNPNGEDLHLIDPQGPVMRAVYTDLVVRALVGFLADACERGLTQHETCQIVEHMCEIHGADLTHPQMREALDAAVEAKRRAGWGGDD